MCVFLSLFFLPNPLNSLAYNMGDRPDHLGNFNTEKNTYMVGIPLSPSTMYVDNPNDNRINAMQNDIATRKRSNTSFQITSVTVQGSRTNTEDFEDSADDFEESHTDDISSDILDSSKFTEPDGYHSEDNTNPNIDDLSPCGPLIITPLSPTAHEPPGMNVGLGIGISSTFPTIGSNMVNTGVTMMTSNLESPVSAQVPMINPLPDNWQHRFKVVKIVSSEPFKRGRWRCMDFKDPPPTTEHDNNHVPAIHVTPSSRDDKRESAEQLNVANTVAHVFEIPVSGAYADAVPVYTQPVQQFYGIFLPPNNNNNNNYGETPQPACIDNVVSAAADVNFNRIAPDDTAQLRSHSHPILFQANQMPCVAGSSMSNVMFTPQFAPYNNNNNNNNNNNDNIIPRDNHSVNGHDVIPNQVPLNNGQSVEGDLVRSNSLTSTPGAITDKPASRINSVTEDTESAASSGTNTVAIDNKIEQAMDLVKSHLMFAVREEVEVLKEKITELLDRISQLEHENDILRANASPETLKQLNQSQKKFTVQQGSPHIQNLPPTS